MLCRLALRNTRRSFGDFAVYFLTLMFGVAAFYAFGSIGAQGAMTELGSIQAENLKQMTELLDIVSMVVAVVLAFLVGYANRFLIKRRNREFGTYLILGMPKRQVAAILVMEALLVGVLALVAGLVLGVAASQGLSLLTAQMFEIDMSRYRLVFSRVSLVKTMGFFGILFAAVSVLNLFGFSRQTVSRLLNAKARFEPRVRNPLLSVVLATVGLALVVAGCWAVLEQGLIKSMDGPALRLEVTAGIVGTLLMFAGGSGLVLRALQLGKRRYLRGLNPFVFRQLDSKVSSTYLTMAVVCITMFFAIVILSGGITFGKVLNEQSSIPYDVSFKRGGQSASAAAILQGIRDAGFDSAKYLAASHEFTVHWSDVTAGQLPGGGPIGAEDVRVKMIGESDADALLRLQGKAELDLGDGGFALLGPFGSQERALRSAYPAAVLRVLGQDLEAVPRGLVDSAVEVGTPLQLMLVAPDAVAARAEVYEVVLVANYRGDPELAEKAVTAYGFPESGDGALRLPFDIISTKRSVVSEQLAMRAVMTYIGIYIGLILLVTSAAILALQQLSEATDNRDRYAMLSKIGVSNKMMSRAVFTQVAVYFAVPLGVALAYSFVGGKVILDVIKLFGQVDVATEYILAAVVLAFVFGGYFVATAFAARRIALEN